MYRCFSLLIDRIWMWWLSRSTSSDHYIPRRGASRAWGGQLVPVMLHVGKSDGLVLTGDRGVPQGLGNPARPDLPWRVTPLQSRGCEPPVPPVLCFVFFFLYIEQGNHKWLHVETHSNARCELTYHSCGTVIRRARTNVNVWTGP